MRGLHYAWIIVICALLSLAISNGLAIGGLSVFDEQLLTAFDWSRGTLKFRDFLTFALAGVTAPFIGAVADRYGVRRLMFAGALMLTAGLFAYGHIQTPLHMYLIHGLFGIALACAGLVVNVMLVSRWFAKKRGTAIGLTLVGTSIGIVVFPKLNTWLLAQGGWRDAFQSLSLVPLALLPLIVFVIRDWPADRGLTAYGADPEAPADASPAAPAGGMEYAEALRTRDFWVLALIAMTSFYVVMGTMQHLFLHLKGMGFTTATAASGISLFGTMALVGKFLLGYLADRFDPKKVLIFGLGAMFAGSLGLASMNATLFWPMILVFGIGWGGLYTMIQLLIVVRFGLKASGRILGTITVLDALGGGLGPWMTGLLYDQSQSYQLSFTVMASLLFVAVVLSTTVTVSRAMKAAPAAG